ncbi:HAD family hydrolase [Anaerobiospirillum thomasii]|uniref:Phosphatase YqaB n=1 Tax=Anaerobiospirillum thomasii TaxID=179995 RepID=A0A2X0WIN8_9GAMM|nr:HAD family phosphatase [Anaerobiospirillum thomasii]SPT70247.1 Phosphatase YqaB [Anaerobiospirillum thomasii]
MDLQLEQYIFSRKAIIFDMDGTLLNTEPLHVRAWNHIAKEYGFKEFDYDYIKTIGGIPTLGIAAMVIKENNLDVSPQEICDKKTAAYRDIYLPDATIFENIASILYKAHDLGIKTALATGSYRNEVQILLNKFDLNKYFNAVITSDNLPRPKPHPDIYLNALKAIDASPSEALVFEDTQIGLQGVSAARIDCILVSEGNIVKGPIKPE